jgi:hypothetical protein
MNIMFLVHGDSISRSKLCKDVAVKDFPAITHEVYSTYELIMYADDTHFRVLRTKLPNLPIGPVSIEEFPAFMEKVKDLWINNEIRAKIKIEAKPYLPQKEQKPWKKN